MSDHWRVGKKLGRTLYRDGQCVGLIDTEQMAKEIVQALNRRGEAWTLYQAAMKTLEFVAKQSTWNTNGSPQNDAARLVIELRAALAAYHQKV